MPHLPLLADYATALEGLYLPWKGAVVPSPSVLRVNTGLAQELGLDPAELATSESAAILAGSVTMEGARPLAMAYAGHQFGGFSPQLGDGRALLLGEIRDPSGVLRDIHLKGSGRTPFSRGGDGKAALGPVLREYLIGEAMHALGVPTTRALAALTTGEQVARETMLPGAVLVRVAASHVRVGTFQFFAARGEDARLRQLAEYAIQRHFPDLAGQDGRYLALLDGVIGRQAALVAKWLSVGFVHGVMNTDNMTISGETIDYGPCAFIDAYRPDAVFSSIDERGRYAYGNQPRILQWNLARFAETLLPLIDPEDDDRAVRLATDMINTVPERYQACWLHEMRRKLGMRGENVGDLSLIEDLLAIMAAEKADFTGSLRAMADVVRGDDNGLRARLANPAALDRWLPRYRGRLDVGEHLDIAEAMDRVNPLYIPRNHKVEEALAAAVDHGDMQPFDMLLERISQPFTPQPGMAAYAAPAPATSRPYVTFCGT